MNARDQRTDGSSQRTRFLTIASFALLASSALATARAGDTPAPSAEQLREGREIFLREWLANDPRSHGGDGLGPVFNDSSCVACHNAGAPGGGGPSGKNVDIVTASPMFNQNVIFAQAPPQPPTFIEQTFEALLGVEPRSKAVTTTPSTPPAPRKPDRTELIARHPGFRTTNSVVVHREGTLPEYAQWRRDMLGTNNFAPVFPGMDPAAAAATEVQAHRFQAQNNFNQMQAQIQIGEFFIQRSQRNPTALFGIGLLDSIPDSVLVEQAKVRHEQFPTIIGRVSQLKDGKIGRFGWKAQTPSLNDFVLTACAVELGLEVPGHPQGGLPMKPTDVAKGLDLTADECASLTAYIRNLPKPSAVNATNAEVEAGRTAFASIGCATCHVAKLGDVEGIYGDLLLHDMGDVLGDTGQYGVFTPDPSEQDFVEPEIPVVQALPPPETTPVNTVVVTEQPSQVVTVTPEGETRVEQAVVQTAVVQQVAPPIVVFNGAMGGMGSAMMGGGALVAANRPTSGPASRQEWRTPPLWGLRDSGPYMHDGRATSIEQAIALHSGEAESIAHSYFALSPEKRSQVQAFLRSLTAPTSDGLAHLDASK